MKLDYEAIITEYKNGQSLNAIAKTHGTYATTIKRILERSEVELRHDRVNKGDFMVDEGERLIEWAKSQGRLVTKSELAEVIGRKKLSPSYFIKYPELGQYVSTMERKELSDYNQRLYSWLQENNILYKPGDRTQLGMNVTALLLEDYKGLALDVFIKPTHVSKAAHEKSTTIKMCRAKEKGLMILFLNEEHFENLDEVKVLLDALKKEV